MILDKGRWRVSARELLIQVEQSEKEIQAKISERSAKSSRNTLDTKLSPELRQLFERWRRE
ncbi:hypothetical protein HMSSN139_56590 [Paenibacillus sp. HMSSN-139]|nr:hypothetical protein HMSSN139_56590 [Paenibacillus sp. HMSSN-139]